MPDTLRQVRSDGVGLIHLKNQRDVLRHETQSGLYRHSSVGREKPVVSNVYLKRNTLDGGDSFPREKTPRAEVEGLA